MPFFVGATIIVPRDPPGLVKDCHANLRVPVPNATLFP